MPYNKENLDAVEGSVAGQDTASAWR